MGVTKILGTLYFKKKNDIREPDLLNEAGHFIAALSKKYVPNGSAAFAKASAAREAIGLPTSFGSNEIILEGDSAEIIGAITKPVNPLAPLEVILRARHKDRSILL